VPARAHPQHAEPVLLIVEGDPFDRARQHLRGPRRARRQGPSRALQGGTRMPVRSLRTRRCWG
jgi:hypothetical protein